jgi:hypothetical protein
MASSIVAPNAKHPASRARECAVVLMLSPAFAVFGLVEIRTPVRWSRLYSKSGTNKAGHSGHGRETLTSPPP